MFGLPLLNLGVIIFLIAMAYWWALQGLFSALLHLAMTITAGALALALWEPITHSLLLGFKPPVAWGVGLLVPFAAILSGLRVACDKLVPQNMHFTHLADMLGGGAAGVISAILTAGITVIGLGFLPFGPSFAGYQPYDRADWGQIAPGGQTLWLPVEHWTAGFYGYLANHGGWTGGAFNTSQPLGQYQPNLPKAAARFRLRPEPLSAVAATDESVDIDNVYTHPWQDIQHPAKNAIKAGVRTRQNAKRLIVIDTKWHATPGVYDPDDVIRIPPTQIRLVAENDNGWLKTFAPLAHTHLNPRDNKRYLYPFGGESDDAKNMAYGDTPEEIFGWVFALPDNVTPKYLMARNLRLEMPQPGQFKDAAEAMQNALGQRPPKPEKDDEKDQADQAADDNEQKYPSPPNMPWISATSDLPDLPGKELKKNQITGVNGQGAAITYAQKTFPPQAFGRVDANLRFDRIANTTLRMHLTPQRRAKFLDRSLSAGGELKLIRLRDQREVAYYPQACVVVHQNGERTIHVSSNTKFQRAAQLPDMRPEDTLYLYFNIPDNITLKDFQFGLEKNQTLNDWTMPQPKNVHRTTQ